MGSLAYAVGGGLEGAGQGIASFAAEEHKRIVTEGLENLRNQHEAERQQAGFGEQEKLQQNQFKEQQSIVGQEVAGRAAVAGAERTSREQIAGAHEKGAGERAKYIADQRLAGVKYAADKREGAAGANKIKPWQLRNVKVLPRDPGTGKQSMTAQPEDVPMHFNPNTNKLYVQSGNRFVQWDSYNHRPLYDEKILSRRPIDEGEMQRLLADPNGIIPPGVKGSGLTRVENFERLHHYLPPEVMPRLTQGGVVNEKNQDAVPNYASDDSGGGEAQDRQDASDAEGDDADATQGYRTPNTSSYASPQPSDNEPAK